MSNALANRVKLEVECLESREMMSWGAVPPSTLPSGGDRWNINRFDAAGSFRDTASITRGEVESYSFTAAKTEITTAGGNLNVKMTGNKTATNGVLSPTLLQIVGHRGQKRRAPLRFPGRKPHVSSRLQILPCDEPAIQQCEELRGLKLRSRHSTCASRRTVLGHSAVLITRNKRDFGKIPGLSIDD